MITLCPLFLLLPLGGGREASAILHMLKDCRVLTPFALLEVELVTR